MENVFQMVLTLAGVVIAVTGIVALSHLSAIRKSLETLARQGQTPLRPARSEEVSGHILPLEEPPASSEPVYRPVVVAPPPPPPPPAQRARWEEAAEQAPPASRPMIVSPPAPPPPPAPVHQTLFEEPEPAVEEAPAPPPPSRAATTPPLPPPAEPGRSRMPTIIGIVVLVAAIGFLVFVVLYTK